MSRAVATARLLLLCGAALTALPCLAILLKNSTTGQKGIQLPVRSHLGSSRR